MDIYTILASKPHNPHYLNRYINFIQQCQQKNVDYEGSTSGHHICPKANDMFPEYKDFRYYSWNKADLTPRQHDIAHLLLWKIYRNKSMTFAWNMMKGDRNRSTDFITDHKKYMSEMGKEKYDGKIACILEDGSYIRVFKEDFNNGGYFGNCKDKVVVKNNENIVFQVPKKDPRYLSGELVPVSKDIIIVSSDGGKTYFGVNASDYDEEIHTTPCFGKVTVKDKEGKTYQVSKTDTRYLSGELVPFMKGKLFVKDSNGDVILIDKEYYDKNIHDFHTKGTIVVKDEMGNRMRVSTEDEKYLSGELQMFNKDIAYGRDSNGNLIKTHTGDKRFQTGELSGNNKNKIWITNGHENKRILKDWAIPEGWYKGKKQNTSTQPETILINNGKINKRHKKDEPIPDGWVRGMTKGFIKPFKFITDGSITRKISPDDTLPPGFRYGMSPKKVKAVI